MLLVLRALGLGDLLTSVPAIRGLRRAYQGHELVLATPAVLGPIVELIGGVDRLIDTQPLQSPSLRGADVAVNLHGSGPESHRCLLRNQPRVLIAFEHPAVPRSFGSPAWSEEEHEVARWCRLLTEHSIACDPCDLALQAPGGAGDLVGATLVHPGAGSGARRWPAERWAKIARTLALQGHRVVITGSESERELALRVAAGAREQVEVIAGSTGLGALARIVAAARLVVSGDTGIAHLAVAYGTPSLTLFGPTPPALWGPPPDRTQHRVLWKGGRGDPRAARPDSSLMSIQTQEVLDALGTLAPKAGTRS